MEKENEEIVRGNKKNKSKIIIIAFLFIIVVMASIYFLYFNDGNFQLKGNKEVHKTNQYSAYRLSGNSWRLWLSYSTLLGFKYRL